MADGDEDLGLGLRLPWGRVSPPPDEAFAPDADPPLDLEPGDGSGGDIPATKAVAVGSPAGFAPPPAQGQAGPTDAPIGPQPGVEALLEAIDRRFDRLDERLAGLEHGLADRLELVGARLAEAASSTGPGPTDGAVLARLERGFDRGVRLLEARLEHLEDRVASSSAATVDALRQVGSGGMAEEAKASDADAVGAVLDRRLDRLETLVASFHEASMGALGRDHERLVAALDASQATLIDRLTQLAPAELVARLLQGVVTTGEMLDAELIDLKRLLADLRPPGP